MVTVSLLGVPHDENSSYMRGAAEAPGHIRRALFCDAYTDWSETGVDLGAPGRFLDLGDIRFDGVSDPWDAITDQVARALRPGHPLISLGGDHAVTHPILRAVRQRHSALTILHIDAHPDIYDSYQGNRRSHASPFARIMEEGLADRLIQVGLRCVTDHHREQFERFSVEAFDIGRFSELDGIEISGPVYLSLDLDAFDPAFAPGVSHREPGGLSTRQVIDLIHRISSPIVAADIVELNPARDIGDLTAGLAAKLVKEVAGTMVRNHQA